MLFLYSVYEFWHSHIDSANFLSYTVVRTKGKDLQGQVPESLQKRAQFERLGPQSPDGIQFFSSKEQKNDE